MEYRKYGDTFYIRMDRGDEIIEKILMVCKEEGIHSCTFNGMLELVSLNGNVITDENGDYYHHTHAVFAYKVGEDHQVAAGHMKSIMVSYTAEIELRPVVEGEIKRKYDPETGTGFWSFT